MFQERDSKASFLFLRYSYSLNSRFAENDLIIQIMQAPVQKCFEAPGMDPTEVPQCQAGWGQLMEGSLLPPCHSAFPSVIDSATG